MQTSSDANAKKTDWGRVIGFSLFGGFGIQILYRTFELLIPFKYAVSISLLILGLVGYPFYVRGTPNKWAKDGRPWKFTTWLAVILVISSAALIISNLANF